MLLLLLWLLLRRGLLLLLLHDIRGHRGVGHLVLVLHLVRLHWHRAQHSAVGVRRHPRRRPPAVHILGVHPTHPGLWERMLELVLVLMLMLMEMLVLVLMLMLKRLVLELLVLEVRRRQLLPRQGPLRHSGALHGHAAAPAPH